MSKNHRTWKVLYGLVSFRPQFVHTLNISGPPSRDSRSARFSSTEVSGFHHSARAACCLRTFPAKNRVELIVIMQDPWLPHSVKFKFVIGCHLIHSTKSYKGHSPTQSGLLDSRAVTAIVPLKKSKGRETVHRQQSRDESTMESAACGTSPTMSKPLRNRSGRSESTCPTSRGMRRHSNKRFPWLCP